MFGNLGLIAKLDRFICFGLFLEKFFYSTIISSIYYNECVQPNLYKLQLPLSWYN